MKQSEIIVILDDVRSSLNVGSILRTADTFGIKKVVSCGITPNFSNTADRDLLPHIQNKTNNKIQKTALGAETSVDNPHENNILEYIDYLKEEGFEILAIEQTRSSIDLKLLEAIPEKAALIFGNEVNGINQNVISRCEKSLEIEMKGIKESLNVSVSVGIVLFKLSELL